MRRITVGTAGHIDHGKTSLVAALTGVDCDRWEEEKRRGITIDLGFAHLSDGDLQISFVDVPGHERFVHNALAGLGGIRLMILVVAADEGVEPQTREHLDICSLLEIPAALAVLTKADLVEPDLLELAELELEEELEGTAFEGAPILTVSSTEGTGIDALRTALFEIADHTLQQIDSLAPLPARLPIDRAFHLRGLGALVTGTLSQGTIEVGSTLEILPGGREARVRSIQVHGDDRERAEVGERVSLQLAGVDLEQLERGDQATEPAAFRPSRNLLLECRWLERAPAPLEGATPVRFHLYSTERMGMLRPLGVERIEPGETGTCELRLEQPVVAVRGDRWVVRRPSPQTTMGGGRVLDPRWVRPRGAALERSLAALRGNLDAALREWVEGSGEGGRELEDLATRLRDDAATVAERLRRMVDDGLLLRAPEGPGHGVRWLTPSAWAHVQDRSQRVLEDYFDRNRLALGMPKAEAVATMLPGRARPLADVYLDWLRKAKTIEVDAERVRLPGRGSGLTDDESRLGDRIASAFEACGLTPPDTGEIRTEVNAEPNTFEGVLRYLTESGRLVRLPSGLFLAAAALDRLKKELIDSGWQQFTVGEFKDRFQLSRKWAIPLLEYLDNQGVTRRVGDARQVLRPKT